MKVQCPGEYLKSCGTVVEVKRHDLNSGVLVLASHVGCRRRYIFDDLVPDLEVSDEVSDTK